MKASIFYFASTLLVAGLSTQPIKAQDVDAKLDDLILCTAVADVMADLFPEVRVAHSHPDGLDGLPEDERKFGLVGAIWMNRSEFLSSSYPAEHYRLKSEEISDFTLLALLARRKTLYRSFNENQQLQARFYCQNTMWTKVDEFCGKFSNGCAFNLDYSSDEVVKMLYDIELVEK